ncbi:MAG: ATP-grasp domain-containing protein [Bacillota bacterium]
MTKLFEYQSKALFEREGIRVCRGRVAASGLEAGLIARELGVPVVVKAQVLVTGRAQYGAIKFADTPEEAENLAAEMLSLSIKGFPVTQVLVEERKAIIKEYYASIIVNDAHKSPVLVFSSMGGSGIEDLARKHPDKVVTHPINVREGLHEYVARNMLIRLGITGGELPGLADLLVRLYSTARKYEARSAEINPIALGQDGKFYALDGRVTIDDNAVYRHPELGIEVAREFDHPPTALDRIAYMVEANDYRGTFYFMQLEMDTKSGGYIGFHGGGGGGSMMAMDALQRAGFKIPNFCDTSGNPPASKIYRAAKIILSQENLEGYFYSGSGVASQEQFHTARGLVKAFKELGLSIPAVIRVGGNGEELAIKILTEYTRDLPAPIEAYGRDTSVDYCVERLKILIAAQKARNQGGVGGRLV